MTRRNLRRVLLALGLFWLLPLFWYDYSFTAGTQGDYQSSLTLGLPDSPWFRSSEERRHEEWGPGLTKSYRTMFNSRQRVEFLSWSALCFAISLLCFIVASRLKSVPAPAIDKPRETPP